MDVSNLAMEEFTNLCEKYFPGDRAESYVRGLLGLTKWGKIVVTPTHMASFDYRKDEAYKTATGE